MYHKLKCPDCGFEFGISLNGEISEEDRNVLFTCPCGVKMDEEAEQ